MRTKSLNNKQFSETAKMLSRNQYTKTKLIYFNTKSYEPITFNGKSIEDATYFV